MLFVVSLVVIAPSSAHAYLDAATGSMIIQTLIAIVAGAAVVARLYWSRLKAFLGFKSPETIGDDERGDG